LLTRHDYRAALAFIDRLYAIRSASEFPHWLLRQLPELVPCDHATWNELALTLPSSAVLQHPLTPNAEERIETFSRLMIEHPCLQHWLRTGEARPLVLSDFLSARELHRTRLYGELYRDLGYEDQVAVALTPPNPTMIGVGLARGTRGFSGRDRKLLEIVRPHIARAHENAQALRRTRRALDESGETWPSLSLVELDAHGRVVDMPNRAARWLDQYGSDRRTTSDRLPEPLKSWASRKDGRHGWKKLVGERTGRRLVARRFELEEKRLLLLEERAAPRAVRPLRDRGLSRRETEVLTHLELGKNNREIAMDLFISSHTVKKHLENAFAKLGVKTRAEAVACLRRLDEP